MTTVAGRTVVVTGATGAVGLAVVRVLVAEGARVMAPVRTDEQGRRLREEIGREDLFGVGRAEIADAASARAFFEEVAAKTGGVHGLAAVAGAFAASGPLETTPPDEWDRMMAANLATTHAACRAALPFLLREGGAIVTVAARMALEGGAGSAAYAVSKSAVAALTRVLALENAARGVRANCVLPGTIDTPENRKAMPDADRSTWTSPDAIARVIAFLLSPDSAAVNGGMIPVSNRTR